MKLLYLMSHWPALLVTDPFGTLILKTISNIMRI
jgi:hypothetical protein